MVRPRGVPSKNAEPVSKNEATVAARLSVFFVVAGRSSVASAVPVFAGERYAKLTQGDP